MGGREHLWKPGESANPKGRPKGVPNHLTKTVKDTVLAVFQDLQSDPKANLTAFAKKYPRDFYNIAAKLIPHEIIGQVDIDTTLTIRREIVMKPSDQINGNGNLLLHTGTG